MAYWEWGASVRSGAMYAQNPSTQPPPYQLWNWDNDFCMTKGRFTDRQYVRSRIIDQVLKDGKKAIPTLISQIVDSRLLTKPVFCYNWPPLSAGELAHFILVDLFMDDKWTTSLAPSSFLGEPCALSVPSWECWGRFRKKHDLKNIQAQWRKFWVANRNRISWDEKSHRFKVSGEK